MWLCKPAKQNNDFIIKENAFLNSEWQNCPKKKKKKKQKNGTPHGRQDFHRLKIPAASR